MCRTITTTKFREIIVFKPCLFMVREMYHLLFKMTKQKFLKLLRPLQQMMIVIRSFFIRELIGEKSTKPLLCPLLSWNSCSLLGHLLRCDIHFSYSVMSEILKNDQTADNSFDIEKNTKTFILVISGRLLELMSSFYV